MPIPWAKKGPGRGKTGKSWRPTLARTLRNLKASVSRDALAPGPTLLAAPLLPGAKRFGFRDTRTVGERGRPASRRALRFQAECAAGPPPAGPSDTSVPGPPRYRATIQNSVLQQTFSAWAAGQ